MNKHKFTFDEAINLFQVGAFGFFFKNSAGQNFTSRLEEKGRLEIMPVLEQNEGKPQ